MASVTFRQVLFNIRRLLLACAQCKQQGTTCSRRAKKRDSQHTASTQRRAWDCWRLANRTRCISGTARTTRVQPPRAWGIIGQPHRDLRPQGAATQSTGAGCIVHPTQVHAFAVRASYPRALSCSLYTVPWTRGWWSRPTDRPSGGDQGWNSITDSRGGIFIAEVTSIHPFTTARQSGAAAARSGSASALSLPLLLSPSAGQAFLPPLPATSFFFLHPWDLHLLHRTFSRSPLILPSLSPHNQTISNPGRVTSLSAGLLPCPINPVSTLDPRSSRPCNPQYKIALLPTWPR